MEMKNGKGMLGFEPKSFSINKELYLSYIPTIICHEKCRSELT